MDAVRGTRVKTNLKGGVDVDIPAGTGSPVARWPCGLAHLFSGSRSTPNPHAWSVETGAVGISGWRPA